MALDTSGRRAETFRKENRKVTKSKIEIPRGSIEAFCKRWRVKELSLFGSVLREDFGPHSDVDVLVSFEEGSGWSLFELVDMGEELKAMLGRDVDLVCKNGLRNPFRRREILATREVVYAA
jgi:uncharacterized protein